jgi:predicted neutral ceramidase superfamily lipid hydrolase
MTPAASIVTAEQARGRATGALFFIGFGELWLLLGLRATDGSHGLAQAFVLLVGAVLLAGVADLFRRAKMLPAGARHAAEEERARRMFRAVNIIQWVSVGTAVAILSILRLQEYIVTAISVIVGLHLLPLAGTFRNRQHYATGMLLVVGPLACLLMVPRSQVSGVTALGAGTVLLLSAAAALVRMGGVWRAGSRPVVAAVERS